VKWQAVGYGSLAFIIYICKVHITPKRVRNPKKEKGEERKKGESHPPPLSPFHENPIHCRKKQGEVSLVFAA
jgi:hypothetical protein